MFVGALVGEPVGDAPARETHRGGGAAKGCKQRDRSAHARRLLLSSTLWGSFLRKRKALTSEADRPGVGEDARLGAGRVEPQGPNRKKRRYSVQVAATGLGRICA
jgi:hypothetical protein